MGLTLDEAVLHGLWQELFVLLFHDKVHASFLRFVKLKGDGHLFLVADVRMEYIEDSL